MCWAIPVIESSRSGTIPRIIAPVLPWSETIIPSLYISGAANLTPGTFEITDTSES